MRRRTFLRESGRGVLALAALGVTGCGRSRPEEKSPPAWTALVAELERQTVALMGELGVPGVGLAVIQDARTVWRRGVGVRDAASKAPVDDATVFEAQSMSKPVFAYVVIRLHEDGVLQLDRPLTGYMPGPFLNGDSRVNLITPRHVLSHTSGLPNWRSKGDPFRINFTPGEKYRYSGEGYSYLQAVVTRVSGRLDKSDCASFEMGLRVCASDFDAFMKARVLSPLGMTSSSYLWTDGIETRLARRHDAGGQPINPFRPTGPMVARYGSAGALLTTPSDYAKFLIAILEPREGDAFRLGSRPVAEMLKPQIKVDSSVSWALGWAVAHPPGGDLIFHAGGITGAHCLAMASVPRKNGLVIMTNGQNGYQLIEKLKVSDVVAKLI